MKIFGPFLNRKQAKEKGIKHYFNGNPCKHGHLSVRTTKGGKCLECHRISQAQRYANDPEKGRAIAAKFRATLKKEDINAYNREWWANADPHYKRQRNKESTERAFNNPVTRENNRLRSKEWYQKNKDYYKQAGAQRERGLTEQYKLLTQDEKNRVDKIYQEAYKLNEKHGPKSFHVDHIMPISKGGKHHPDNLQILSAEDNLRKGRKFDNKNDIDKQV